MTATEIISLARSGELRQLSTSVKDDTPTLITFINLGLLELYKRFSLKTGEALITLVDGKTIYSLDGTDPDVDLGGDSYLYIIAAYGAGKVPDDYTTDDILLPLNVEDDQYSVNTISYNQVQLPLITAGSTVSIIFVAKPIKVTALNLDDELDLSDTFTEALLSYIGYRGHVVMDSEGPTESNIHYARFEKACLTVREFGVGIAADDLEMVERVYTRGFV